MGFLLLPSVALAQAAQITDSKVKLANKDYMLFRCDISGSIAGTTGIGGEACESGDWTSPLDCRDETHLNVQFFEYGTGNGQMLVWDCKFVPGDTAAGGSIPGEEDPSSATTPGDPDPLCVELSAPAGVADFNGVDTRFLTLSNLKLGHIILEVEDCTANCDSSGFAACWRPD